MRALILAAAAAFGLTGCIAVPAPYPDSYYYGPPAVGVGIYAAPGFYYGGHGHRHHHHHYGRGHWR